MWIVIVGTLALAAFGGAVLLSVTLVPRDGAGPDACAKCGYSLTGLPAAAPCPECGSAPGAGSVAPPNGDPFDALLIGYAVIGLLMSTAQPGGVGSVGVLAAIYSVPALAIGAGWVIGFSVMRRGGALGPGRGAICLLALLAPLATYELQYALFSARGKSLANLIEPVLVAVVAAPSMSIAALLAQRTRAPRVVVRLIKFSASVVVPAAVFWIIPSLPE